MPEYRHGVYVKEAASDLIVLSKQESGLTLVVGTSPIRTAADGASANEPVLCSTYNEAVAKLGYSTDTGKYTLCEAMDVLFGVYQVAPVVMVNVYDPENEHRTEVVRALQLVSMEHCVTIEEDVVTGVKVETKSGDGDDETWTDISAEVTLTSQDTETTVLTLPASYAMGAQVYVSYAKADVTKVLPAAVSGTVDAVTGKCTGLETISEVYSRFGYTVGTVIAPGWSRYPEVALKMAAKAELINGHFSALAIADLPTNLIGGYGSAYAWKTTNGYASPYLAVCYPMVKYGEKAQYMSTHLAGRMARQTAEDDQIPYRSPSNRVAYISGMCNEDGTSNYFGEDAARELNGQGIITVTNFNGWKFWGNRTSAYPGSNDPKDCWVPIRRMFNYIKATLVLNFWSQLDEPILKRQLDSIVNSANTYLNGLTSRGAILGGRVVCMEEDNPTAELADGKVSFRCYVTPPSPARELSFTVQYDAQYLTSVF